MVRHQMRKPLFEFPFVAIASEPRMVASADAKRHAAQIVRRLQKAYPDAHALWYIVRRLNC